MFRAIDEAEFVGDGNRTLVVALQRKLIRRDELCFVEQFLAGTCTPRPPTPSVPLTKLLNRRGLTGALLLLALAATKASTRRSCTATSTTSSATSTTAAAASTPFATAATASTAATDSTTPGTTPTTTSTSSTAPTASPTAPSTTPAALALAGAASPSRGRRNADLLSANEVDSSSRGNRGEKGDRGTLSNIIHVMLV
ncbi:unnamed protein product [Closterium sp. NIES-53]